MHGATADKKASEPNSEGATVNLLEIKLINYVGEQKTSLVHEPWRYESCGILNQNPAWNNHAGILEQTPSTRIFYGLLAYNHCQIFLSSLIITEIRMKNNSTSGLKKSFWIHEVYNETAPSKFLHKIELHSEDLKVLMKQIYWFYTYEPCPCDIRMMQCVLCATNYNNSRYCYYIIINQTIVSDVMHKNYF